MATANRIVLSFTLHCTTLNLITIITLANRLLNNKFCSLLVYYV